MNDDEHSCTRRYDAPRAISDGPQTRPRTETQPREAYAGGSQAGSAPGLGGLFAQGLVLLLVFCWVFDLVALK
ncbi:hypothetical protein [Brevundimonas sp. SL130]|uniref:hypothetical protein n=1 Tax=Brevundimonas sp. SL130 TaxID=2995143 RepID=UPI00226D1B35|nr:hypothetical protein [Brevundimonas sp. SL130]WAC58396.1 hypothetical protein OU998_09110 [Brevundimonas sp. SL130]